MRATTRTRLKSLRDAGEEETARAAAKAARIEREANGRREAHLTAEIDRLGSGTQRIGTRMDAAATPRVAAERADVEARLRDVQT